MSFSIICGAPGTRLSAVADSLNQRTLNYPSRVVFDVEENLKERIQSEEIHDPRFQKLPHKLSMGDVCTILDRFSLRKLWQESASDTLRQLHDKHSESKAMSCHLTLFNGSTLEFFSAADAAIFTGIEGFQPNRVILLIDDIYDMLEMLASPNSLLDPPVAIENYAAHATKVVGFDTPSTTESVYESLIDTDKIIVGAESLVERLLLLLQWRRAEMIAAESLANALGVPLTVLGIKHPQRSLEVLIDHPRNVQTVYLSHKITDARRHNRNFYLPTDHKAKSDKKWPQHFVDFVNQIPDNFFRDCLVTVQPTAIDELRFSAGSKSFSEREFKLLDRWPIPNRPISGVHEHSDLGVEFGTEDATTKIVVSTAARRFEKALYDEIAFRDHLLVSCNDHLLVFRPLIFDGRLSGGVRREVEHWGKYWCFSDDERASEGFETSRRAVFVHLLDDVLYKLNKLKDGERFALEEMVIANLSKELQESTSSARKIFSGSRTQVTEHLARSTGHVEDRRTQAKIEACKYACVHSFLEWFCDASQESMRAGVAMIIVREPTDLMSVATVETISNFFRSASSGECIILESAELVREGSGLGDWCAFAKGIINNETFEANPKLFWD